MFSHSIKLSQREDNQHAAHFGRYGSKTAVFLPLLMRFAQLRLWTPRIRRPLPPKTYEFTSCSRHYCFLPLLFRPFFSFTLRQFGRSNLLVSSSESPRPPSAASSAPAFSSAPLTTNATCFSDMYGYLSVHNSLFACLLNFFFFADTF